MLEIFYKIKMHLKANRDQVLREVVDTFQNRKEQVKQVNKIINISKKLFLGVF